MSINVLFFQYMFSIGIDDVQVFSEENAAALIFENVTVYAGDPWHNAANGYMTNFVYSTQ